jgi:PP-loop superfamily ATP-utilizing enzyme
MLHLHSICGTELSPSNKGSALAQFGLEAHRAKGAGVPDEIAAHFCATKVKDGQLKEAGSLGNGVLAGTNVVQLEEPRPITTTESRPPHHGQSKECHLQLEEVKSKSMSKQTNSTKRTKQNTPAGSSTLPQGDHREKREAQAVTQPSNEKKRASVFKRKATDSAAAPSESAPAPAPPADETSK